MCCVSLGYMDLENLREEIDSLDEELIDVLVERLRIVSQIGECKKEKGLSVVCSEREVDVLENARKLAVKKGLDPHFIEDLFVKIIHESRKHQ